MILGDNIFYGNGFRTMLKAAVKDAEENGRALSIGICWLKVPSSMVRVLMGSTLKLWQMEE